MCVPGARPSSLCAACLRSALLYSLYMFIIVLTPCHTPVYYTKKHLGEGGSGVVQTAWALLGLLAGGCNDKAALDRGRDFLMRRQLPTGDWAQEGITGVFNRSCGITYTAYRNLFPMWALARYAAIYESADE
jgi:squalene cyclase